MMVMVNYAKIKKIKLSDLPDEITTEDFLKTNDKIDITEWEDWLQVKWRRVK